MTSRTFVSAPHGAATADAESAQGNVVLDRIAARVRQRLVAEQTTTNRFGDGAHAASLIWPWPL